MRIEYKIYNPAGNITALVEGTNYTAKEKSKINNEIMKRNPKIEQVGFISKTNKELEMAGGEFCGNAIRCATHYYLKGKIENSNIKINNYNINVGITKDKSIWCDIPINWKSISKIENDVYRVDLIGITIVVIKENLSRRYISMELKTVAQRFINSYKLQNEKAVGFMFLENINGVIKINPVVWVRDIHTLFLENSCGSGTIGTAMVETYQSQKDTAHNILQPSGETLNVQIINKNGKNLSAILSGKIKADNKFKNIIIEE